MKKTRFCVFSLLLLFVCIFWFRYISSYAAPQESLDCSLNIKWHINHVWEPWLIILSCTGAFEECPKFSDDSFYIAPENIIHYNDRRLEIQTENNCTRATDFIWNEPWEWIIILNENSIIDKNGEKNNVILQNFWIIDDSIETVKCIWWYPPQPDTIITQEIWKISLFCDTNTQWLIDDIIETTTNGIINVTEISEIRREWWAEYVIKYKWINEWITNLKIEWIVENQLFTDEWYNSTDINVKEWICTIYADPDHVQVWETWNIFVKCNKSIKELEREFENRLWIKYDDTIIVDLNNPVIDDNNDNILKYTFKWVHEWRSKLLLLLWDNEISQRERGITVWWYCLNNWDNDYFLTPDFWNQDPRDEAIICALYGKDKSDQTAYTMWWDWYISVSESCNEKMTVVRTNTLPDPLDGNTIYVLTGRNTSYESTIILPRCTAIVSSQTWWKDTTIVFSKEEWIIFSGKYWILDNLSIYSQKPVNGIWVSTFTNSTINVVKVYNRKIGINLEWTYNLLNNVQTYWNDIWIDLETNPKNEIQERIQSLWGTKNNVINNSQIYRNNEWLIMKDTIWNIIYNTEIYQNKEWLNITWDSNNNIFEDIELWNNNKYNIYVKSWLNNTAYWTMKQHPKQERIESTWIIINSNQKESVVISWYDRVYFKSYLKKNIEITCKTWNEVSCTTGVYNYTWNINQTFLNEVCSNSTCNWIYSWHRILRSWRTDYEIDRIIPFFESGDNSLNYNYFSDTYPNNMTNPKDEKYEYMNDFLKIEYGFPDEFNTFDITDYSYWYEINRQKDTKLFDRTNWWLVNKRYFIWSNVQRYNIIWNIQRHTKLHYTLIGAVNTNTTSPITHYNIYTRLPDIVSTITRYNWPSWEQHFEPTYHNKPYTELEINIPKKLFVNTWDLNPYKVVVQMYESRWTEYFAEHRYAWTLTRERPYLGVQPWDLCIRPEVDILNMTGIRSQYEYGMTWFTSRNITTRLNAILVENSFNKIWIEWRLYTWKIHLTWWSWIVDIDTSTAEDILQFKSNQGVITRNYYRDIYAPNIYTTWFEVNECTNTTLFVSWYDYCAKISWYRLIWNWMDSTLNYNWNNYSRTTNFLISSWTVWRTWGIDATWIIYTEDNFWNTWEQLITWKIIDIRPEVRTWISEQDPYLIYIDSIQDNPYISYINSTNENIEIRDIITLLWANEWACWTGDLRVTDIQCNNNDTTILDNSIWVRIYWINADTLCAITISDNEGSTVTWYIKFIRQRTCNPDWNNDYFLTPIFWDQNPDDGAIICALYGSGNWDQTAYTTGWNWYIAWTSCSGINEMNVVWTWELPNELSSNTIYVLTGEIIGTTSTVELPKCTAIVSNQTGWKDSTIIWNNININSIYGILDNISIKWNNLETWINITKENNTLNVVKVYQRSNWIHVSGSNNMLNNIQSFGNNTWIELNWINNAINNSQIYRNNIWLNLEWANHNIVYNTEIYQNNTWLFVTWDSKGNKFDTTDIYNNKRNLNVDQNLWWNSGNNFWENINQHPATEIMIKSWYTGDNQPYQLLISWFDRIYQEKDLLSYYIFECEWWTTWQRYTWSSIISQGLWIQICETAHLWYFSGITLENTGLTENYIIYDSGHIFVPENDAVTDFNYHMNSYPNKMTNPKAISGNDVVYLNDFFTINMWNTTYNHKTIKYSYWIDIKTQKNTKLQEWQLWWKVNTSYFVWSNVEKYNIDASYANIYPKKIHYIFTWTAVNSSPITNYNIITTLPTTINGDGIINLYTWRTWEQNWNNQRTNNLTWITINSWVELYRQPWDTQTYRMVVQMYEDPDDNDYTTYFAEHKYAWELTAKDPTFVLQPDDMCVFDEVITMTGTWSNFEYADGDTNAYDVTWFTFNNIQVTGNGSKSWTDFSSHTTWWIYTWQIILSWWAANISINANDINDILNFDYNDNVFKEYYRDIYWPDIYTTGFDTYECTKKIIQITGYDYCAWISWYRLEWMLAANWLQQPTYNNIFRIATWTIWKTWWIIKTWILHAMDNYWNTSNKVITWIINDILPTINIWTSANDPYIQRIHSQDTQSSQRTEEIEDVITLLWANEWTCWTGDLIVTNISCNNNAVWIPLWTQWIQVKWEEDETLCEVTIQDNENNKVKWYIKFIKYNCHPQRNNDYFVTPDFWKLDPRDEAIICALYWNWKWDQTAYTTWWKEYQWWTSCSGINEMNVVWVRDNRPDRLDENTIYVLTKEIFEEVEEIKLPKCTAIISNQTGWKDTTIKTKRIFLENEYGIFDNISMMPKNSNNEWVQIQWSNNTLNVFKVYNQQIWIELRKWQYNMLNNIQSYGNNIWIYLWLRWRNNAINNSQIYRNNIWLNIEETVENMVYNTEITQNKTWLNVTKSSRNTFRDIELWNNNINAYAESWLNNTATWYMQQYPVTNFLEWEETRENLSEKWKSEISWFNRVLSKAIYYERTWWEYNIQSITPIFTWLETEDYKYENDTYPNNMTNPKTNKETYLSDFYWTINKWQSTQLEDKIVTNYSYWYSINHQKDTKLRNWNTGWKIYNESNGQNKEVKYFIWSNVQRYEILWKLSPRNNSPTQIHYTLIWIADEYTAIPPITHYNIKTNLHEYVSTITWYVWQGWIQYINPARYNNFNWIDINSQVDLYIATWDTTQHPIVVQMFWKEEEAPYFAEHRYVWNLRRPSPSLDVKPNDNLCIRPEVNILNMTGTRSNYEYDMTWFTSRNIATSLNAILIQSSFNKWIWWSYTRQIRLTWWSWIVHIDTSTAEDILQFKSNQGVITRNYYKDIYAPNISPTRFINARECTGVKITINRSDDCAWVSGYKLEWALWNFPWQSSNIFQISSNTIWKTWNIDKTWILYAIDNYWNSGYQTITVPIRNIQPTIQTWTSESNPYIINVEWNSINQEIPDVITLLSGNEWACWTGDLIVTWINCNNNATWRIINNIWIQVEWQNETLCTVTIADNENSTVKWYIKFNLSGNWEIPWDQDTNIHITCNCSTWINVTATISGWNNEDTLLYWIATGNRTCEQSYNLNNTDSIAVYESSNSYTTSEIDSINTRNYLCFIISWDNTTRIGSISWDEIRWNIDVSWPEVEFNGTETEECTAIDRTATSYDIWCAFLWDSAYNFSWTSFWNWRWWWDTLHITSGQVHTWNTSKIQYLTVRDNLWNETTKYAILTINDTPPSLTNSNLRYTSDVTWTKLLYENLIISMWVIDGNCWNSTIRKTWNINCTAWSASWSGNWILVTPPTNTTAAITCTVRFIDDEWTQVSWDVIYNSNTDTTPLNIDIIAPTQCLTWYTIRAKTDKPWSMRIKTGSNWNTVCSGEAWWIWYTSNTQIIFNSENDNGIYYCFKAQSINGIVSYKSWEITWIDTTPPSFQITGDFELYECETGYIEITGYNRWCAWMPGAPYMWYYWETCRGWWNTTWMSFYSYKVQTERISIHIRDGLSNETWTNQVITRRDHELYFSWEDNISITLDPTTRTINPINKFELTWWGSCEIIRITTWDCSHGITQTLSWENLTITASDSIDSWTCTIYFEDITDTTNQENETWDTKLTGTINILVKTGDYISIETGERTTQWQVKVKTGNDINTWNAKLYLSWENWYHMITGATITIYNITDPVYNTPPCNNNNCDTYWPNSARINMNFSNITPHTNAWINSCKEYKYRIYLNTWFITDPALNPSKDTRIETDITYTTGIYIAISWNSILLNWADWDSWDAEITIYSTTDISGSSVTCTGTNNSCQWFSCNNNVSGTTTLQYPVIIEEIMYPYKSTIRLDQYNWNHDITTRTWCKITINDGCNNDKTFSITLYSSPIKEWVQTEETFWSGTLWSALDNWSWDRWFLFFITNPQKLSWNWVLWNIKYEINFNSWVADEFYYITGSAIINWYKEDLNIKRPTFNYSNPRSYLFNFPVYNDNE